MKDSDDREGRSGACYKKALDLLARRPHFQRELASKLERRGFGEVQIRETCRRLAEQGLLDDLECARGLLQGHLKRGGYGPRRVRADLARRGAREETITRAVNEAFKDGEGPLLRAAAKAWLVRNPWNREKLARHLDRKGFHAAVILGLLEELRLEEEDPQGADPD